MEKEKGTPKVSGRLSNLGGAFFMNLISDPYHKGQALYEPRI